jgi:hypothetical protein
MVTRLSPCIFLLSLIALGACSPASDSGAADTSEAALGGSRHEGGGEPCGCDDPGPPAPPPPVAPSSSDPFDAASCSGVELARADAISKIGAGQAFAYLGPTTKLLARKRSCNAVTGCGAWGAPAPFELTLDMAQGGDNYPQARSFDVRFALAVLGGNVGGVVEEISNHADCPGCTPGGVTRTLGSASIWPAAGLPEAEIYFQYPAWVHTGSGFRVMNQWQPLDLGPASQTTLTITSTCARLDVLSGGRETEFAVLFRY